MQRQIEIDHVAIKLKSDFKNFTQSFENLLKQFDPSILTETDPQEIEKHLKEIGGKS